MELSQLRLNKKLIYIFAVFSYFMFLYYLNFNGFIFPNDGVYYIAVADYFLLNLDLKDPIYYIPRDLVTPQVSHIFVIASLKYIFGEFWVLSYISCQFILLLLAFSMINKKIFVGSGSNETYYFFILLLLTPLVIRNLTNFQSEGFYIPLLIICICLFWDIMQKENFNNYISFSILALFLVFYRLQFVLLLLSFAIVALIFKKDKSFKLILSIVAVYAFSFFIYLLLIKPLILENAMENSNVEWNYFLSSFIFEFSNFFTFPLFHEKFVNMKSLLIFKFCLSLLLIYLFLYFQIKYKVFQGFELALILILSILNIFFLSYLNYDSQRYYLISYLFFLIYAARLITQTVELNFQKLFYSLSIAFIGTSIYYVSLNFINIKNGAAYNYYQISKSIDKIGYPKNIICDEPRVFYWNNSYPCKNIFPDLYSASFYFEVPKINSTDFFAVGKTEFIDNLGSIESVNITDNILSSGDYSLVTLKIDHEKLDEK